MAETSPVYARRQVNELADQGRYRNQQSPEENQIFSSNADMNMLRKKFDRLVPSNTSE